MSANLAATDRPAISDRAVASLQRAVDTGYREARKAFLFNEDFAGQGAELSPFTRAIDAWKRRQAACIDNRCRLAELTEQRDRLNFANGTGKRPISGMPWRTGSFILSATAMAGTMSILPVGDGSIVVTVTTFGTKGRDWDCAGFTATGTLSRNGYGRMTLYDEDPDGPPLTFTLQALSPTSTRLSSDSAQGYDDICRTGTIFGTYKAAGS
jgi:hypothetical protein